jgi:hypothetical protein
MNSLFSAATVTLIGKHVSTIEAEFSARVGNSVNIRSQFLMRRECSHSE